MLKFHPVIIREMLTICRRYTQHKMGVPLLFSAGAIGTFNSSFHSHDTMLMFLLIIYVRVTDMIGVITFGLNTCQEI